MYVWTTLSHTMWVCRGRVEVFGTGESKRLKKQLQKTVYTNKPTHTCVWVEFLFSTIMFYICKKDLQAARLPKMTSSFNDHNAALYTIYIRNSTSKYSLTLLCVFKSNRTRNLLLWLFPIKSLPQFKRKANKLKETPHGTHVIWNTVYVTKQQHQVAVAGSLYLTESQWC